MLSKSLVAATLALAVSAQTSTSCSPLKQECPADPAVGKKGISCDFTKGACDAFVHLDGTGFTYGANGAVGSLSAVGQAPTLQSKETIFFGKLEVEMQAAPGQGIITSIVLLSDDLDEIDLEAVGSDNGQIQSNTFSKGDDTKHDLLGLLPVSDLTGAMHKYTVDWTTDRIDFYVDGSLKRTLRRADIPDRYPQTPMHVKVGAWVAGYEGNAPGTISWAGGVADFSHGPHNSYFKSITVTDYAGGSSATTKDVKEYVYGDRSGSSGSIQIHLADGSSTTGDSPSTGGSGGGSSSSSSSSSSSTPSSTPSSTLSSTATKTTETTKSSTTESKTTSTTTKETPITTTTSKTNSTLTHTTMTTKTTGTQSDDGSGTITQTTTVSAPPTTKPTTGAAACLSVGFGLAAAAAFFAL